MTRERLRSGTGEPKPRESRSTVAGHHVPPRNDSPQLNTSVLRAVYDQSSGVIGDSAETRIDADREFVVGPSPGAESSRIVIGWPEPARGILYGLPVQLFRGIPKKHPSIL